jgi:hypothetical protein
MSYTQNEAIPLIQKVIRCGFDAGVHGVEIDDVAKIKKEFHDFAKLSGLTHFGIRAHYVRYNETTFQKFNEAGYLFDSSEFNKNAVCFKQPYKIGNMWEFPLHIMDGYILANGLKNAKTKTLTFFDEAENMKSEYITFLFHDYGYNEKTNPEAKNYYEWFVNECERRNYTFISYKEAIKEL